MTDNLYFCNKTLYEKEGYHILQRLLCDLIQSTIDDELFEEKFSNFKIDKNIFRYLINKNVLYLNLNKNYFNLIINNIVSENIYDFLFIELENETRARFNLKDTEDILKNYDFDIHLYSEKASKINIDYVKLGLTLFNGIIDSQDYIINTSLDFHLGSYLFDTDNEMNLEYFKIIKMYHDKEGSFRFDIESENIKNTMKMYFDFFEIYKKF